MESGDEGSGVVRAVEMRESAGIREGRMAESGAELKGRWAGSGDGEGQRVAGRAGRGKIFFKRGAKLLT